VVFLVVIGAGRTKRLGGWTFRSPDTESEVREDSVERGDGDNEGISGVDWTDDVIEKRGGLALLRLIGESGSAVGLVDFTGLGVRLHAVGVTCCCGTKEEAGRGLGGAEVGVGRGLERVGEGVFWGWG
jgi:hypothetical protein